MLITSLTRAGALAFTIGVFGGFVVPAVAPLVTGEPAQAQTTPARQSAVKLSLTAAKKVVVNGKVKLEPIANRAGIRPGDTIVYTITAQNTVDRPINRFILNQAVPRGTQYVLNSAKPLPGTQLLFSIDGGKNYSNAPIVDRKPAPASAYTHIRWAFSQPLAAKSSVSTSYELQIK
jgi:uncharacterized repeat protein (TIGR01451 family)